MSAIPANTGSDAELPASASASPLKPDLGALWEYFLRLIVVAFGIVVGTILAFIIAMFCGWIDLKC